MTFLEWSIRGIISFSVQLNWLNHRVLSVKMSTTLSEVLIQLSRLTAAQLIMSVKCLYLGNVRLRSSFMKTWLPFWTALISVLCPVSCLLQFFFFFTARQRTHLPSASLCTKMSKHKVFTTSYFFVKENNILVCNREDPLGLILTCGFAVGFLAVGTVIYVDIWCVILINPNTAGTTQGKL